MAKAFFHMEWYYDTIFLLNMLYYDAKERSRRT